MNLTGAQGVPETAHRRGFTLVELMVVVVLIGIMAAVIIPEMRGTYEDALLRSTSREMLGVLSMAGSRAISINQLHRLRVDQRTGRYAIERPATTGEGGTGFVAAREVSGGEGVFDARIKMVIRETADDPGLAPDQGGPTENGTSTGSNEGAETPDPEETISFYPDGTADAREILLEDRQGFQLDLKINPTTSRVTVAEVKHQ